MRDFWQEWIRVLSRELILVALLIYFHATHSSDVLQGSLIAGMLALMNSTRFQYPRSTGDKDAGQNKSS